MRNYFIASAVLAAALVCSPLAFAAAPQTQTTTPTTQTAKGHWVHPHHAMRHRAHHDRSPWHQLNLTDAQRTSIRQLMRRNHAKDHAQRQALHNQRKALADATPGTTVYQNAAKALATASANAAHARVLQRATQRAKIYALLTPAQRSKLAAMHAQRHARMQQWHKAHMHHTMPAHATSSASH